MNELPDLLATWLPRQRWFAAKGRPVRSVTVVASTPLPTGGEPLVDHLLLAVAFDDGSPVQHYQLHLGRREHSRADLEHVVVGHVDGLVAYDALFDVDFTAWLIEALREGRTVGELAFVPEPGAEIAHGVPGRVLGIEQSNTSVSWGERSILKVFRRVVPGLNPDLELHRALRSVGSHEVAALQGAIEGTLDGAPATLGMLQDFAANSADGWSMALASVRDLLAEADLRADEVGGDFAGEASRLGETIGVVHDELRRALGTAERDAREIAAVWHQRLAVTTAAVPALAPHVDAVRATYDAVAGIGAPLPAQRVHGDLHLGQTLRTPYGWLVIDFEGEPAAPLSERVRPDSHLRDVAGMLRSFDYAAFHQILLSHSDDDTQLEWRANEWAARNRSAFCDGYALRAGVDPREQRMLLRAFELDKAVYELLYETRSRPAWAPIPLASIARLTSEESGLAR
ncbi:maltokinase N-terminal cap-like domain-containing protein [Pseudonocardia hydrocarbonoxydans]|uniref:Maltokinase n=1 Tax=Pseudonocardia hydrocarbonoxydans TaxID=76726 RepID=A0A4Y3WMF0_9PSEU|nr:aminoglycoside phosphotransferase [Pseudonocardia hydrocarbonoxydans]GEC19250.1 aminoglycoside phosphotransferase [Pseudonocardia hydrocarbonoxydans]